MRDEMRAHTRASRMATYNAFASCAFAVSLIPTETSCALHSCGIHLHEESSPCFAQPKLKPRLRAQLVSVGVIDTAKAHDANALYVAMRDTRVCARISSRMASVCTDVWSRWIVAK